MTNIKFKSKRPELSIAEVLDQYECTVDDLFHLASIGELTIHVLADDWKAHKIYSVDNSKEITELSVVHTGSTPSPVPNSENHEEFELQYQAWKDNHNCQNVTIGKFTFYGRQGEFRVLYDRTWPGLQPIAAKTFIEYRKNSASSIIELQLDGILNSSDNTINYFLCSDPEVLLQDALKDGKLFVMKTDMQKLVANASLDPEDVKPKGAVSRKTLLKLVLGMAINRYDFDPNKTRTDVPKTIEIGVNTLGIDLSDDTIRKALNEAVATIPSKPA